MTVPSAILLNNNDWGFGYFVLDDNSIKVFESSLSKINSSLNRAVIIGQLIIMMRQIEYPANRLPAVLNQLIEEKNQNLINALFGAFQSAQAIYLPPETVPKFNKETASFFFKKAAKETQNEALQMFCIDKAISFVTEHEHLRLTADWIHQGKIIFDGTELKCQLTP